MGYWLKRILNILTVWTCCLPWPLKLVGKRYRRYSDHYCLDCVRHFPFRGKGKLVSFTHQQRAKHSRHTIRSFGWRGPNKHFKLDPSKIYRYTGPPLPESFSLEKYLEDTGDQVNEGSCTGWGFRDTYAIGTKLRKRHPKSGWSWRCAYNLGRVTIEKRPYEEGAYVKDVMQGCKQYGECTYPVWPSKAWEDANRHWYDDPTVVVHPDDLAFGRIQDFKIIITVEDLLGAIYEYNGADGGIWWYENWMTIIGRRMPKAKGDPVGGHSVAFFAFNTKEGTISLHNSWGPLWADRGKADVLIEDIRSQMSDGEFYIIIFPDPPQPEPEPQPTPIDEFLKWLKEEFQKIIDYLDTITVSAS